MRRVLPILICAGAMACNPFIYDELLEGAWVESFSLRGPAQSAVHNSVALTFPPQGSESGHVLMAGSQDATMVWFGLSEGASMVDEYPTLDQISALVSPIKDPQSAKIGGMVVVPSPTANDPTYHVLVSFVTTGNISDSRVVRMSVPLFGRTSADPLDDVYNREVNGSAAPGFGKGLAAINLDAAQTDPSYEVMVASDLGPMVFDNLDQNRRTYQAEKGMLDPADVTGENEAQGRSFTLCDNLPTATGIAAGHFFNNEAVFVVATQAGLTFVGVDPDGATNLVGAPIFNCNLGTVAAPAGATHQFGRAMFISDLNGDGALDLAVGDPGANFVQVYLAGQAGLTAAPNLITPSGAAAEYGASIGRADLGGQVGSILLVGAPATNIDQEPQVGKVFAYNLAGDTQRAVLADMTPERGSRHGIWAGGVSIGERDELVVVGARDGRIHVAISKGDPYPGMP